MSNQPDGPRPRPTLSEVAPIRGEPWPELVAFFREKLAEAERGELAAFAYGVEYTTGECGTYAFHNIGSNAYKLVGALEVLKVSIIERHLLPR